MDYTSVTKVFILLIVVLVLVWDAYVILVGHQEATFSVILYESSKRWPIIAFVLGLVCGHLFWQVYTN
jgi:hypothetical protein